MVQVGAGLTLADGDRFRAADDVEEVKRLLQATYARWVRARPRVEMEEVIGEVLLKLARIEAGPNPWQAEKGRRWSSWVLLVGRGIVWNMKQKAGRRIELVPVEQPLHHLSGRPMCPEAALVEAMDAERHIARGFTWGDEDDD